MSAGGFAAEGGVRHQFSRPGEEPASTTPTTTIKRARIQHVGETKRETIVFFLLAGVVALGLGSALTWYGASRNLPDFYIIGPILLLIGLVLVAVASGFIARVCITIRRTRRLVRDTEHLRAKRKAELAYGYRNPGVSDPDVIKRQPPTTHVILRREDEEKKRATLVDLQETRGKRRDIAERHDTEIMPMPPLSVPLDTAELSGAPLSLLPPSEESPSGGVAGALVASDLPGAELSGVPYSKTDKSTKPPLQHSSHGNYANRIRPLTENEILTGSDSSTSLRRGRVMSGDSKKTSPSPDSGILSPPVTPLSRSGVEVEVINSSSL